MPIALAERGGSSMKILSRGLVAAALLAALAAAPALAAPTVTIRVEGEHRTLLPQTTVTLDPAQVPGVSDECPGDTVAGAIDKGTNGDWDKSPFVQTILGERRAFERNDYWAAWYAGKLSDAICQQKVSDGDDVVLVGGFYDDQFRPVDKPLTIREAPRTATAAEPFEVYVTRQEPDFENGNFGVGSGVPMPAGGVVVSGGGARAVTGADGRATLRIDQPGSFALQAATDGTRPDRSVPAPVEVGAPGAPPPEVPAAPAAPLAPPCLTNGADGRCGTRDLEAPTAFITSVREGAVFARRRGPRELSGTAGILAAEGIRPDGTGILMIKLRLTRRAGARCSTWSPSRERFVRRPCGAANGFWFRAGERADWEYLLPARLGSGRYVLDADAIDRNGNRLRTRRRGENRVVFRVR
jgi:hypothetical protein